MNEKKKLIWELIDDIIKNGFEGNEERVYYVLDMFYNEHIFSETDGIIELCLLCSMYEIENKELSQLIMDSSMLVIAHKRDDYILNRDINEDKLYSVFSQHIFD